MKFRAELESTGKNTAGFVVPGEVVDELGDGKRPKVSATVNGFTFRTSIAPMGGRFLLGMSMERRAAANVDVGTEFEVDVELDTAPREVEVPDDLQVALEGTPGAKAFWDTLPFSKKQWHVVHVTSAKKAETRAARVAKSVTMLAEHRAR